MSREVCGICWCPYDEAGKCGCPPCATQECMPSECPNCASLDRRLAELEEGNADELTVAYMMGYEDGRKAALQKMEARDA